MTLSTLSLVDTIFSIVPTGEELGESEGDDGDAAHVPVPLVRASVRPGMIQV